MPVGRRYLFNGVSDPRAASRWPERILLDRLERNPGDMVYSHAVMNALDADGSTEFRMTGYYYRTDPFSDAEIGEIAETCSAFVCPLADMFSKEWIRLVRLLTDLIRRLRIPCVVPCVGGRDLDGAGGTDDIGGDVSAFVRAVLDKSAVLGVRGASTARLLRRLGFEEGRHFIVLGCPTLFAYGPGLPPMPAPGGIRFDRCAVTLNHRADPAQWRLVDRCGALFGRADLVSQWFREPFHFLLTNRVWSRDFFAERPGFAETVARYADRGRMRFFLNRRPWAEFLSTRDFTVGNRIHGSLLSILSGTPAAVVPFESRTEELAEFHGIPILRPVEGESDEALRDRIGSLDFSELVRRQREQFETYHSFFRRNGLETVFDRGIPDRSAFPLERRMPIAFPDDAMPPWSLHSPSERASALAAQEIMRVRKEAAARPGGLSSDPPRRAECEDLVASLDRDAPLESIFSLGMAHGRRLGRAAAEKAAAARVEKAEKNAERTAMRLRAAEDRLAAIQSSLSWRATAPVRLLGGVFGRKPAIPDKP